MRLCEPLYGRDIKGFFRYFKSENNWRLFNHWKKFCVFFQPLDRSPRELKKESGNSKLGVFIRVDSCPFVVASSLFEDLVFNVFDTDSDAKQEFHHEGLEAHEDRKE